MITPKELDHLGALARIKLTEAEKAEFSREFGAILGYVDQLKEVNVSMAAEGRVGAVKNATRPDEVLPLDTEDRDRLLKEAPYREKDFIAVKKIIEQD